MSEQASSQYFVMPANLLANPELSQTEKLLLCVVFSLSGIEGYCFASNDYLGGILGGLSAGTIANNLTSLHKKRLIEIDSSDIQKRKITLSLDIFSATNASRNREQEEQITKSGEGLHENVKGASRNRDSTPYINNLDNNLINTKLNNTSDSAKTEIDFISKKEALEANTIASFASLFPANIRDLIRDHYKSNQDALEKAYSLCQAKILAHSTHEKLPILTLFSWMKTFIYKEAHEQLKSQKDAETAGFKANHYSEKSRKVR